MANYSIKDLEKISGIKAHTLRIWEKRYDLVKPKRTITNIRYYDDNDLKKILNIAMINHGGTRISRIAVMDDTEISERINNISQNSPDVSAIIENLVTAMISLDEEKFRKIFGECVENYGFEQAIIDVVYPFFEKTGALWQTCAIIPAHEHFITNLIRQKICVAINDLAANSKPNGKNFIIYLPEGELHETGLMFYHYLTRSYGHNVIYLGQSLPIEDLKSVQRMKCSDYVVTSFSSAISGIDIDDYVKRLAKIFRNGTVLYSVYNNYEASGNFPHNVTRVTNANHFVEILKSI